MVVDLIKSYGEGYGGGNGNGYGYGYGYGYGNGCGCGDGDGYGYGNGNGVGNGYGYGKKIGYVVRHAIYLISPWQLITIGCECLPISEWIENWRSIAEKNDIPRTDELAMDVERLTKLVQETTR